MLGAKLSAYPTPGIERGFACLKDPLIVNDLFLKRPERIEALGFVLLAATIFGWDRKPTTAGSGTSPPAQESLAKGLRRVGNVCLMITGLSVTRHPREASGVSWEVLT